MIWNKQGIVLEPVGDNWVIAVEPNVIYEGNPQILTEEINVFKMWYREQNCVANEIRICYAESTDGLNWIKYLGNPVLTTGERLFCPFVTKHASIYYLYVHSDWFHKDRFYSSDGINWIKDKDNTLVIGSSGQWDGYALGNAFVWIEGTEWKMLYEARASVSGVWKVGLATSSNGKTWSKSSSNPVLQDAGSCSCSAVHKIGSIYHMWFHKSPSGHLPSDIWRAKSGNLTFWIQSDHSVLWRTEDYEGVGNPEGQVADPCVLEVNGITYMWYSVAADQTPPPNMRIACAKVDLSIEKIVQLESSEDNLITITCPKCGEKFDMTLSLV